METFTLGEVAVTPYPAGHLVGAVSYGLEGKEGRVFHTGDVSNTAGYTTEAAFIPDPPTTYDGLRQVVLEEVGWLYD